MESIRRLNQAIHTIRELVDPKVDRIQFPQIQFFLEVVLSHPDPISMATLGKKLGLGPSTVSRNSREVFGTKFAKRDGKTVNTGLGWVDSGPSRWGGKEHDVWLTPEGIEVAQKLALVVDGGEYAVPKR